MKFKIKELLAIKKSIKKLVNQNFSLEVMLKLVPMVEQVEIIYKRIEDYKQNLYNTSENEDTINKRLNEYLETETELNIVTIPIDALEVESYDIMETESGTQVIKVPKLNVLDIKNLQFLFSGNGETENLTNE